MRIFLGGLPDELARPPVNLLRVTLHPDGLAPRILNLRQWRTLQGRVEPGEKHLQGLGADELAVAHRDDRVVDGVDGAACPLRAASQLDPIEVGAMNDDGRPFSSCPWARTSSSKNEWKVRTSRTSISPGDPWPSRASTSTRT
jgi:hypothetical protein